MTEDRSCRGLRSACCRLEAQCHTAGLASGLAGPLNWPPPILRRSIALLLMCWGALHMIHWCGDGTGLSAVFGVTLAPATSLTSTPASPPQLPPTRSYVLRLGPKAHILVNDHAIKLLRNVGSGALASGAWARIALHRERCPRHVPGVALRHAPKRRRPSSEVPARGASRACLVGYPIS